MCARAICSPHASVQFQQQILQLWPLWKNRNLVFWPIGENWRNKVFWLHPFEITKIFSFHSLWRKFNDISSPQWLASWYMTGTSAPNRYAWKDCRNYVSICRFCVYLFSECTCVAVPMTSSLSFCGNVIDIRTCVFDCSMKFLLQIFWPSDSQKRILVTVSMISCLVL